ncbi:MAG: hypothetical protein GY729_06855 [Desulfobacteraceae bacterium]|nr:hypothetical protein [Desulfobacteraceae bacterium]
MTKNKKYFAISLAAFLIIAISGGFFVVITGANMPGNNQYPFFGHGCFAKKRMPHFMQREIGEFVLWRMDKKITKLGLNENQKAHYDQFRSKLHQTMEQGINTRLAVKSKFRLELESTEPDLEKMVSEIQKNLGIISNNIQDNLTLFNMFYNSLDDEQKKMITDVLKEKCEQYRSYHSSVKGEQWEADLQEEHLL